MTPLGTLIFSIIGGLFVAAVGALIWWVLRKASVLLETLQRNGWAIEKPPSGTIKWIARRVKAGVAVSVEYAVVGVHHRSERTSVRMAADTGTDDVLVERKLPGFIAAIIAADSALAAATGFKAPPRWNGGSPAFAADYNAYASSASAAARWLSEANQSTIVEYNSSKIPLHFFNGVLEASWSSAPLDAAQIEGVVALLDALRRSRR